MDSIFKHLVNTIKSYNTGADMTLIKKAYKIASEAHGETKRKSGEPYISHPLAVAQIVAEMKLDTECVVASLLHDVVEDTEYKNKVHELEEMFGKEVCLIVEGVTKMDKIRNEINDEILMQIKYDKQEQQIENLRKMFLAMAKDIRVIFIKLADRLHNMRTLSSMTEVKQIEKAAETLEVYAPLAHRLGMSKIKWELEDLSLRYLDHYAYYEIFDSINQKREEREELLEKIKEDLMRKFKSENMNVYIDGRVKHFYSIYNKMFLQNKTIDEIYDLFAIRIIVNSVTDCYNALGIVHSIYINVPSRFKDYISAPKPNLYQSLHTGVVTKDGTKFEVQIRTWDMHKIAEYGIAAHWQYKENKNGNYHKSDLDSKLTWVREMLETQRMATNIDEFKGSYKIDLYEGDVFVFTPKGKIIHLPNNSTVVDFAYTIHTDIGNHMTSAKVNSRIVGLSYTLQTGDIVEILTSPNASGPNMNWEGYAKTSRAKSKIKDWIRKNNLEENYSKGKAIVEKGLKRIKFRYSDFVRSEIIPHLCKKFLVSELDDLYVRIGLGEVSVNKVIEWFLNYDRPKDTKNNDEIGCKTPVSDGRRKHNNIGITVSDMENYLVRISQCCNPVPGDEILGYVTKGRGVSIHIADCLNITRLKEKEPEKIVDVKWEKYVTGLFLVHFRVLVNYRGGIASEISKKMAKLNVSVCELNMNSSNENGQYTQISLSLEVKGLPEIGKIISNILKIEGVVEVKRMKRC